MRSCVSHWGQDGREHLHREMSTENVTEIDLPGEHTKSENLAGTNDHI